MRAITDLRITRRLVKRQEFLKSRRSKLVLGIISPLIYSLTEKKMAILWAEHVTLNTAKEDNGVFEQVRQEFSEEEVIELTLMCGFFNLFNRLTDSLHIPIEEKTEVDKIKRSVNLDPLKVKNYLEMLVDHWPSNVPGPNPD